MSGQELSPWERARAEIVARRPLLPGEVLIFNANPHELRSRMRVAVRRGEWACISPVVEVKRGGAYIVVHILKHPRRVWPWWMAGSTVVFGWLVVAGFLFWHYRWQIFTITSAVLLAGWMFTRINHRGACSGLHCSGCRG